MTVQLLRGALLFDLRHFFYLFSPQSFDFSELSLVVKKSYFEIRPSERSVCCRWLGHDQKW